MRDPEFRIPEEETVGDELQRQENLTEAVDAFDPLYPPSVAVMPTSMLWLSLAIIVGIIIFGIT